MKGFIIKLRNMALAVAGSLAIMGYTAPIFAQTILLQNARVHTMGTAGLIENGDILIRNGVITGIGSDLTAPDDAVIIDAAGQPATPGLIAPYSSIGLKEINAVNESNDSRIGDDFEFSAVIDAADAFNPSSVLIPINRAGGVTRALSAPAFSSALFSGQAAIVDLSGQPNSVTKTKAAQIIELAYNNGIQTAGNSRMGVWALLRDNIDAAIAYAANPRDYVQRGDDRYAISDLKALGQVIAGQQPLIVHIHRASDMRNLIRFKNNYNLEIIIIGGAEAWRVADELAAANISVILNPLFNLPGGFELLGATLANAARLHAAGVNISFYGYGAHNLRQLPQFAGNAVAEGLPYEAGLAALTISPARMLGIDGQLGSLEIGKIADIVIWSGDPLELSSRPTTVLINGQITPLENRQTKLRDRYKDLSRGALPHAYRGGE